MNTAPPLSEQRAMYWLNKLAKRAGTEPDKLVALLVLASEDDCTEGVFRAALGIDPGEPLPWKYVPEVHDWALREVGEMQKEQEEKRRLRGEQHRMILQLLSETVRVVKRK